MNLIGRMLLRSTLALSTFGASAVDVVAQADPLVGRWMKNIGKSKSEPGSMHFISWTSVVERVEAGYQVVGDGFTAEGKAVRSKMVWRLDGKETPIVGDEPPATYSWKRIDDCAFETVRKDANGTITTRSVIALDGRKRINFHVVKNADRHTTRTVLEVMYKQ